MLSRSSRVFARRTEARYRFMYPTEVIAPVCRKAVSAERHCLAERPIGFSRKTGTPACAANSSTGPRANGGVQTKPASISFQRMLAASVKTSQPGYALASAEARAPSTSQATLIRWPSWDALRACCKPIRPQPTIAMRNESDRMSALISGPDRLPDLAHLRTGHRRIERERALDGFEAGPFGGVEKRALVSGPSLEPGSQVRRRPGFDDVHARAPDAHGNFPDETVVAQAVNDHPAAVIGEDGGDHRNDRAVVPGQVAHRQAGRWINPLLHLAPDRFLELAKEISPTPRHRLSAARRQSEVLQRDRAHPPDLVSGHAQDGSSIEERGQRRQEILSPVLQRKDEAAVVEPCVIPFDVGERHPQDPAGLEDSGRRQLTEADAPGRCSCPNHHAGRDAQWIRQIEHPRVRASAPKLGCELADPRNDTQRSGQSTGTQRLVRGNLETAGGGLRAGPAPEGARTDLVHDHGCAIDGLVQPARRRDAPAEGGQPALAVAPHSLERLGVLPEQAQVTGRYGGGSSAKRFYQRRGEGRASAQDGNDRLHALCRL